MKTLRIGDAKVNRVLEFEGVLLGHDFFPDLTARELARERDWLMPHHLTPANDLVSAVQSFVIRTPRHNVLVDACGGNDKDRVDAHMRKLKGPWLQRLAMLGLQPEDIDYVLCTHLHPDHVGWNTRLANGRWTPTFPNAKYLMDKLDFDTYSGMRDHPGLQGSFHDSVLPVMEAGLVQFASDGFELDGTLKIEGLPGHSPGQIGLRLRHKHREALFIGDAIHHPIQIAHPAWSTAVCLDPQQARMTRTRLIERALENRSILMAAHFAGPVAGRISRRGQALRLKPLGFF